MPPPSALSKMALWLRYWLLSDNYRSIKADLYDIEETNAGFIRIREMSGKFKIFQGQGIVREFHNLSGKIEFLLKCQGNVREF